MIDYRRFAGHASGDTRMLSPPPVFVRAMQMTFGLSTSIHDFVSKYDVQIFVMRALPKISPLTA
jgi:hypothetical protein